MSTETSHSGMRFGYARVSTLDQNEALQMDELNTYGCDRVFVDRVSGKLEPRPALDEMLGLLRAGDTVVVWRLDRLGRSLRHWIDLVAALDRRGVAPALLRESIDTSNTRRETDLSRVRCSRGVRARPHPRAHHSRTCGSRRPREA